jgi:hypothetical protein
MQRDRYGQPAIIERILWAVPRVFVGAAGVLGYQRISKTPNAQEH